MEGIRVDLSHTDTVTCNTTDDLGAGHFFSGMQPFTYFAKNSMTDHLWGLLLNSGRIWDQGVQGNPNDNTWNGTFSNSQTHAYYSIGNNSPFKVQSSSQYNPTNNTRFPNQLPQTIIPFTTVSGSSSLNCTTPTTGGDLNRAMEIGVEIAEDLISYPAYDGENRWLQQWALYNYTKENPDMLEDGTISDFYYTAAERNLGKLYRVLEIMGNMENLDETALVEAEQENENIDPENGIESSWKAVNAILIHNAMEGMAIPNDNQLSDLHSIAEKCPLSHGPAVYIARSILAMYDTSYTGYEDVCEQPDTTTGSGSRLMAQQTIKENNIKLYPNPNSGNMLLACELAEGESGELVIYDLAGKAVKRFILVQDQAVMPVKAELPNGIYLYRVIVDGKLRKTDKLVIVR
jgi:hypothetical protein